MNETSRVGYASLCAQIAEKPTIARDGPTPPLQAYVVPSSRRSAVSATAAARD
jgi:hypothetical protein